LLLSPGQSSRPVQFCSTGFRPLNNGVLDVVHAIIAGLVMARVFVSHSSKDNLQAMAFQRWLEANGWAKDDIFLDLHGIGAGERWRDTLRKANSTCEAIILLASPDSLGSVECQKELELAEALGKVIVPAILRDLAKDDPRLGRYAEHQLVDLSAQPMDCVEQFEHEGSVHQVALNGRALAAIKVRLEDLGVAPDSFAWPPKDKADPEPYPGLSALNESDAGIFFGRDADIMSGLTELRHVCRRGSPRLFVIQAASGSGKSSFLRAGLWPRLQRDRDFAPLAILRPAQGILNGPNGLAFQLVRWFTRQGKQKTAGSIHSAISVADLCASEQAFRGLVTEAATLAEHARRVADADASPPSPLIAIDQGEELFSAEDSQESERFLQLLAAVLKSPPEGVDPYVLITIRADSVESLLQRVAELGLEAPKPFYLPPLSPGAYRDVILRPAAIYSKQIRRLAIDPALAKQLVADASGADALPLLAFTLSQLFKLHGPGQELTLDHYNEMGGMGGCVTRVLQQAQNRAGAAGSDDSLRSLVVPGLATWDTAAGAAKRLVGRKADVIGDDRAHLAPLAHALIEARLLVQNRDTLEVAHEALLRRPPIAGWLDEQKDALKLRDDLLREAAEWDIGGRNDKDLLRRGERLSMALALLVRNDFSAALAPAKNYLAACQKSEAAARRRSQRTQASIYAMLVAIILALVGWINQRYLMKQWNWYATMRPYMVANIRPYVLSPTAERTLAPFATFRECAEHCPLMVVLPAGTFTMGSPASEKGRSENEGQQHQVTLDGPFAVAKFDVTFADWDACVSVGGCDAVSDSGMGRGSKPIVNVSWDDAQQYVKWFSMMTDRHYRLLSESEWEYAARAGTTTAYSWGDEIDTNNADCIGCGSQWDGKQTAPVGSFKPNSFGLYDMQGNVFQWVEDCYHDSYRDAPTHGSANTTGDCSRRVVRGGAWARTPNELRSAYRHWGATNIRIDNQGFRIARTLNHPQ
jgi:formylglycine-generating enzyme required for sulfatase activity